MQNKFIGKIGFYFFCFIVFVVMPFINSAATNDPEFAPRFFLLAVLLVLFSSAFLSQSFIKKNSVDLSFLAYPFFVFAGLMIVATAFSISSSVNAGDAFFEWLRISLLFIFLIVVIMLLKRSGNNLRVLVIMINVSVLIFTGYGLVQLIPLLRDYFANGKPIGINYQVASSLANKNFYAEVIFLCLPFSGYLILISNGWQKYFGVFNLILILITLFFLQTFSTWTALFISSGICLAVYLRNKNLFTEKKENKNIVRKSKKIILVPAVIVLLAIVFIFIKTDAVHLISKRVDVIKKYATDLSLLKQTSEENNNSTYERIMLWKNSVEMIREKPVTGIGLSNWKILVGKYGIGGTIYLNSGQVHPEHPHNDYLFMWAETGLAGIIFWLLIFIFAIRNIFFVIRNAPDKNDKRVMLLMLFAVVGFMVMSFFGYPRQRIFSMIMLVICFAIVQMKYSELKIVRRKISSAGAKIFFVLCILISGFAAWAGWQRWNSEVHLKNALTSKHFEKWNEMERELDLTSSFYYPLDFSSTPIEWYKGFAFYHDGLFQMAFEHFKEAEKINPYHIQVLSDLGSCYEHEHDYNTSVNYYQRALRITPLYPDALLNLSAAYYNAGKTDSAFNTIDMMTGRRMSMSEQNLYKKFLPVILYAKAKSWCEKQTDEKLKSAMLSAVENDSVLNVIYLDSKKYNRLLENELLIRGKKICSSEN